MLHLHSYDESTIHFHVIDQHVKRANDSDSASYQSLVDYLQQPLQNDPNREILLARALVVWVCHVQSSDLSGAAYDTPMGLVEQMKDKNIDHSRVFKMLCAYAGIECEIIHGRAKAIRYQAGDADSDYIRQNHTWNAFKAGGQWHLMHPQWCVQSYVGYVHGGENVLERNAKHEFRQNVERQGVTKYQLNDFWFCTNPEIFVTRCLPNDAQWQCLPNDKVVRNVNDFLSLPDLRQGFYRHKLQLIGQKSCVIETKNGKCNINILAPKYRGSELQFSYELLAQNVSNIDVTKIPLLVLFIPNNPPDTFNFEASFPAVGTYRLKTRLGQKGQPLINCCEFKIDCKSADPYCRKLPVDTGIQGWGYTPDAEDAGLKQPSTSGAKIQLNGQGKGKGKGKGKGQASKGQLQSIVEFRVDGDEVDNRVYSADIYKASDGADNKESAVVNVDQKTRKLRVQAPNVERLNQAALVINSRHKTDPATQAKPCLNYMLMSDEDKSNQKDQAAISKDIKQAKNQQKMNHRLEKKRLLVSEQDKLKQDCDNLMKLIADNEACDSDDSN